MVEADKSEDLEFKWCKKKGVGGKNKEIQFYESFRFDGVDYSLYDSVYLYKEGDPEPYIGKLVKIWENPNKTKKVKVLWFFRPFEIQKYLENEEVHENELFLASGEGAGLANINPLEAIAGKCDVICISTDERNRKPVDEELRMAEFVFHRTFDVGQQKISDKIDEQIAGIEAKLLLNRAAIYKFDGITKGNPINNEGNEEGGKTTIARDSPTPRIMNSIEGKSKDGGISIEKESLDLVKDKYPLDKTNSRVVANVSVVDGRASTTADNKIAHDRKVKKSQGFGDDDRPLKRLKHDDKLPRKEDKDYKDSPMANNCTEGDEKDMNRVQTSVANVDRMGKPSRQSIGVPKDKSKLANKAEWLDKDPCKAKVEGNSSSALERSDNLRIGDETNHYEVIEVTRRPNLDKKTWFKKLPFEEGLESAIRKGTLVLLRNLVPSFTSSEVEDIIWHAFKEDCTARMIQQTAISGRHSGQAFVIFQTREAAEKALRKLDEDCLLLSSNGRPIVASPADLNFISKQRTFHGHQVFNNLRQPSNRETKETVSTSHCAQSNTIEYEMALEWCLLHDRQEYTWNQMHKQHGAELRKLKAGFKGK